MRALLLALLLSGCASIQDFTEEGRPIEVPAFTVLIIRF
jgi:uncharacterized protein YceK